MPYPPVLNPKFLQWETWPHVYRKGMWITNVTGHQAPVRLDRVIAPTGLQGLGEVPWQCWDQPGFKECQQTCFDKAQQAGVSTEAQSALIDQCFNTTCVEPCRSKIVDTATAPESTTKTIDEWLAKATPMNIAIVALAVAIGTTLLLPPKKGKKRGSR